MTAVLVVAAIAVVGAVVARVTWRRPADERHSIQSHQQTLETLRAMSDRRAAAPRHRAAGSDSATDPHAPPRLPRSGPGPAPAAPSRSNELRSAPTRSAPGRTGQVRAPVSPPSNGEARQELVFVDDAGTATGPRTAESAPVSPLALSRGLPRASRHHHRGLGSRSRARSRLVPVVAAVVALGVVVGIAVALAPSHHDSASGHRPPSHTTSARHATTTSTTIAAPPSVRPTSSTAATAAYGAPPTTYTLALRATGPCWVEATETSTGTVVWTGTLASGQTRSIAATGNVFLRLGAANDISVTLNGEQVVLPTGFVSPFDMTFQST